jgi:hypothetical protein
MIDIKNLKKGDYVFAEFDGQRNMGPITRFNKDEGQVGVMTNENEFWYAQNDVHPIPLNATSLTELGFEEMSNNESAVKYSKGAFRLVVQNGDFSNAEMWYREDRRHHPQMAFVHELQNHYLDMTKIHLEK